MIELLMTGYCEHCTFRDLELFNGAFPAVICTHRGVCKYYTEKDTEMEKRIHGALCGDKTAQNAK